MLSVGRPVIRPNWYSPTPRSRVANARCTYARSAILTGPGSGTALHTTAPSGVATPRLA